MSSATSKPTKTISTILWISGIVQLAYFTCSHWFFHRVFFNALGIYGPDLESGFVISQLQLIGAMVLGFALLTVLAASDPQRYRAVIAVTMFVGTLAILIFVGNVALGRVPAAFMVNATLLLVQIIAIAFLYPWQPTATPADVHA